MNIKVLLVSAIALLGVNKVFGQDVELNMRMVKPFKADGNSNEWNEPLNEYNNDTKLAFALANDDQNLYLIIESLDPVTTRKVLFGGITLNINTAGKKKEGVNLIFPFQDRSEMPKPEHNNTDTNVLMPKADFSSDRNIKEHLSPLEPKELKVMGFKNINDGILAADNEFGIQYGMLVKKNEDLIFEIAIPLSQLQLDANYTKAIAYNIKLNFSKPQGAERAKSGREGAGKAEGGMGGRGAAGGMAGRGAGMGAGRRGPQGSYGDSNTQKSDFWIKYKLVKA